MAGRMCDQSGRVRPGGEAGGMSGMPCRESRVVANRDLEQQLRFDGG